MTVAKTDTIDLSIPAVYEPKWEIYVNQNWELIDLEFQKYSTELVGSTTETIAGINDLSDSLDTYDTDFTIDTLNIAVMENEYLEMITYSAEAEYIANLPEVNYSSRSWVGTSATPVTKSGALVTITDAIIWAAIGIKQYKIQRQNLSWTLLETTNRDFMIVIGNYDFSALANSSWGEAVYGPTRTSFASNGFIDGRYRLAEGIGDVAKVGDTIQVNGHEYYVSAVVIDKLTLQSQTGGENIILGPDDIIYGTNEPYIGIVEYDINVLTNPDLLVIGTVINDALKFNHFANSFQQKMININTIGVPHDPAGALVTIALPADTSDYLMPLNFSKRIVMDEGGANEEIIFRCSSGTYGQGSTASILSDTINILPIGISGSMGNRALISGTIYTDTYDSMTILLEG